MYAKQLLNVRSTCSYIILSYFDMLTAQTKDIGFLTSANAL